MRALALFLVLVPLGLGVATARAWHSGPTYGAPAGAGGGGGLFYTGSPRDRGWTCATCHVDAPRELRVSISSPEGLFETRRYTPGATYAVTIRIENERLGLGATRSNFNSMVVTVMDGAGNLAGTIGGFDAARFVTRGNAILASSSTVVGETEWTFTWTAPAAGTGRTAFYVAVVDGDGAGSGGAETLTDPFGDDLALGRLELDEE